MDADLTRQANYEEVDPQPAGDSADPLAFPPAPAWAVGADREHQGPSGMGPGEDQPGFGQEIDLEDAEGVLGGFTKTDAEAVCPED